MIFILALNKELMGLRRSGKLLVLAAVLLLFGLTSPFLAKFTPEILKMVPGAEQFSQLVPAPTLADAVGQYVKNVSQFAVLLGLVLTMGMVAGEKDKGTAGLILTKPLPRPVFIMAKFTALALIFAISIALGALGAWYYTRLLFGPLAPLPFTALNLTLWVWTLVYVAAVLLFSTLSKSQALAAGLGLVFLIVLGLFGAVPAWKPAMPDTLLQWGTLDALGAAGAFPWAALVTSLAIIGLALLAACALLQRQEL
ncbi:MAG: ABC transporter permease [Anaerolineae bacterium]